MMLFLITIGINVANAQILTNSGKHSDAVPASIIPTATAPAGLHLKFELDSVVYDEIGIYYSNSWSDNYDSNDSFDLDGLDPQVYLSSFTADGVRVSINAWSSYTTPSRIKLYVRANNNGVYTLSIEDFTNIDTSLYAINLIDNQQKDSVNLIKAPIYTFNITNAADTTQWDDRFVLSVETKPLPPYQLANFAGQKVPLGVQVDWKAINAGNYTGFTLQKLNAASGYDSLYTIQSDSATNYSYVDQHPMIGNNIYRLQQNGVTGLLTYSAPITIGYGTVTPTTSLNIYPNPSKNLINIKLTTASTADAIYTADIYDMSGLLVLHQSINSNALIQDISNYKQGVYFIQLKDTNGALVGQSKFMKSN